MHLAKFASSISNYNLINSGKIISAIKKNKQKSEKRKMFEVSSALETETEQLDSLNSARNRNSAK